MTEVSNTFEGGSDGTTITAANSGGDSGTAFNTVTGASVHEFDSAQAAHGSLSSRFNPTGGTTAYYVWQAAMGTLTDHYGRFYLRVAGYPSAATRVFEFRDGTGLKCGMRMGTTGKIGVVNAANSLQTETSATLSTNTWYRIEFHFVHDTSTTGQYEVRVYAGDSGSATETISGTTSDFGANCDRTRIGMPASAGNWGSSDIWMDDLVAGATDWPGSAGTSDEIESGTIIAVGAHAAAQTLLEPGSLTTIGAVSGTAATPEQATLVGVGMLSATEAIAIHEAGSVVVVTTLAYAQAHADAGTNTALSVLAGSDVLVEAGTILGIGTLSASETVGGVETGTIVSVSALAGTQVMTEPASLTTIIVQTHSEVLAENLMLTSVSLLFGGTHQRLRPVSDVTDGAWEAIFA